MSLILLSLKILTKHVDVCVGGDVHVRADNFVAADVAANVDVDADLGSMGQNAHQCDESMQWL